MPVDYLPGPILSKCDDIQVIFLLLKSSIICLRNTKEGRHTARVDTQKELDRLIDQAGRIKDMYMIEKA